MSFHIDPAAPLDAELRRIAGEQFDKAAAELRDSGADRNEAVHDTRKRAKKLRALLRLARAGDPDLYRAENRRLRDLARALSGSRDRTALIEAARDLARQAPGNAAPFRPVLKTLEARRDGALAAETDDGGRIDRTLAALAECARRIDAFELDGPAAKTALNGYALNYRRARRALRAAENTADPAVFHELRKRAKYHAHHLRLLGPLWPEAMKPLHEAAAAVAEDLGRDHDYAVLLAEIAAEPDAFGAPKSRDKAVALVRAHSDELRARALDRCRRLFAEKPERARRRLAALWRAAARPRDAAR